MYVCNRDHIPHNHTPNATSKYFYTECYNGLLFTHRAIAKASASIFFIASFS